MNANAAETLRKHVEGERIVMFTTVDAEGSLVSRPMTVQEFEGWVLRFIAQADNDLAREADGREVNLAIAKGSTWVSLSGTARVVQDVAKKQELWNKLNEAYGGAAEDPNNVILEVHVDSGEYWDGGNPVGQVLGLAKAALTGEQPKGEHGTAEV